MHAGPRERSKPGCVNAIIAVRQFESVADRSQRPAGCGAKVCYNTLTLMATRHPYSDDAAPRARCRNKRGGDTKNLQCHATNEERREGGEEPSDFGDISRPTATGATCSEIKCIDVIWHEGCGPQSVQSSSISIRRELAGNASDQGHAQK